MKEEEPVKRVIKKIPITLRKEIEKNTKDTAWGSFNHAIPQTTRLNTPDE